MPSISATSLELRYLIVKYTPNFLIIKTYYERFEHYIINNTFISQFSFYAIYYAFLNHAICKECLDQMKNKPC